MLGEPQMAEAKSPAQGPSEPCAQQEGEEEVLLGGRFHEGEDLADDGRGNGPSEPCTHQEGEEVSGGGMDLADAGRGKVTRL